MLKKGDIVEYFDGGGGPIRDLIGAVGIVTRLLSVDRDAAEVTWIYAPPNKGTISNYNVRNLKKIGECDNDN